MSCDSNSFKAGNDIIMPMEFAKGDISGILSFEDFTKIELKFKSTTSKESIFSTDTEAVDVAHLITLETPTYFEAIIPSTDSIDMRGRISLEATFYFMYKGTERKVTDDLIDTEREVYE